MAAFRDEILAREIDLFVVHHSLQAIAVAGLLPTSIATISVIHEHPIIGGGHVGVSNPGAFDIYVGVSRGVAVAAKQILGSNRRVEVILNGVAPGDCPEREQHDDLRVLFVGRLVDRHKGVLLLPSIVKIAADHGVPIHLDVIGRGEDGEAVEEEIDRLQVRNRIAMRGTMPQQGVFAEMERADILLLPSRHEGLALVIVEAMMRGSVPVATNLFESTAESVQNGVSGILVRERTAEAFVNAIEGLWRNPGLMATFRKKARERAISKFSESRMLSQYEALFAEALALPRDRTRIQYCPKFMNG